MPSELDPQALNAEDVRKPAVPMAVYHQEAADMLYFLARDDRWQRLYDVGLEPGARDAAEAALGASREAQSRWAVASRPHKPEDDTKRELRAAKLRSEAISAARFNLRHDRGVQGALDRIQEGDGAADLSADCMDLAHLIQAHQGAFEKDKTFDAHAVSAELAELGPQISAAISARRVNAGDRELIDARDRAYTILDDILDEVRDAGRHAFRNTGDVRHFGSEYLRRAARRTRSKVREA